jgi:isoamylase
VTRGDVTGSANLVTTHQVHHDASGGCDCDGSDDNRSCNLLALRAREQRAFLLTLVLSGGVPMLLGGDELSRSPDNDITGFDWSALDAGLVGFTKGLLSVRRRHPVFRRHRIGTGAAAADLRWFTPTGAEMAPQDWAEPCARSIALFIDGATDPDAGADGAPLIDDDFFVFVNTRWEPLTFSVPGGFASRPWEIICDSFDPARTGAVGRQFAVGPRSAVVLRSG